MLAMLVSALVFMGSHFVLSSTPLRGQLVATLGERGFLVVFSVTMIVQFVSYLLSNIAVLQQGVDAESDSASRDEGQTRSEGADTVT